MMNIKKFLLISGLACLCGACQSKPEPQTVFIPAIEVKAKPQVKHPLGIIGATEPVYILPMKAPFQARIDTGAETSSIDVDEYHYFERDGEKWVSFKIKNAATGESHTFEKRLVRKITIRRIKQSEKRPMVRLDVKFGGQIIKALFSLAKRENFEYQALIGRNILTGRAIVDTSLSNTLH